VRRYYRGRMSSDFKLTPHADYVHVELAADYELEPDGTAQLIHAISDACARQSLRRVLIEGTIARWAMGMMDSFSLGSLVGSVLPGGSVACCFSGFAPDQQTEFFKDVSQNRGVRIEFFPSRETALRWLGVGAG